MMYVRNSCVLDMLASEWPCSWPGACAIWYWRRYLSWPQCHIHICRPSSGQRSAASQLLAAAVPYCRARWPRDFCHLPRTCMSPRSQIDRLSCAANSLWHLLRRWSLWGHRMRSCQYRACMPVPLPGNEREINEPQLMDKTDLHSCTVYRCILDRGNWCRHL